MHHWQLIFNPHHLFSGWQISAEKKGPGLRCLNRWSDCDSFLGILPLSLRLTALDVSKSTAVSSRASGETMCSVTSTAAAAVAGVGRRGYRGLMTWALLTLALFACSAHRLIFWHPKYSATFHQTVDRQPHLNGRNFRESHHNPGLHTQKFKTFIIPLHRGAGLCPPRRGVSPRGGISKGQWGCS